MTQTQLHLVSEANRLRVRAESLYIYDYAAFNACAMLKPGFDIFEEGLTHTSVRYVVHHLTKELKSRLGEVVRSTATKQQLAVFHDIFKPSLGQFDEGDIQETNEFIRAMFPYRGCSINGDELEKRVGRANWITVILSLRIIWSLLPQAIVPWESYHRFSAQEQKDGYKNYQSFYQQLPLFLPSHNHSCVLFEFLEILIAVFQDDYFLDVNSALDLVFTAGQVCFGRKNYVEEAGDDDLHTLQTFYYQRGYAFHHIFVSYLRSLSKEPTFTKTSLLPTFSIDVYPPKPYNPVSQKALTLTVPMDDTLKTTNYTKLISLAANATSRIYSSNHAFTRYENTFLDKFESNPHKIIENFFSKSSRNYLLKFDSELDFDNFKVSKEITSMRKNIRDGTLSDHHEFVSTFINDFNRYGFESRSTMGNNPDAFLADTINLNFDSNLQSSDSAPVRLSKLDISEWFINAWKYETFLGYLQNTAVIKLTKTIGDCDWLIIASHEKVSETNRYLTPPSSASTAVDEFKKEELTSTEQEPKSAGRRRSSLLPPLATTFQQATNRKSVNRVSIPSQPLGIAQYEKQNVRPVEQLPRPSRGGFKSQPQSPNEGPLWDVKDMPPLPAQRTFLTPEGQVLASPVAPPPLNKSAVDSQTSSLLRDPYGSVTVRVPVSSPYDVAVQELPAVERNEPVNQQQPLVNEKPLKEIMQSPRPIGKPVVKPPVTPVLTAPEIKDSEHPYQKLRSTPPKRAVSNENPERDQSPLTSASTTEPLPKRETSGRITHLIHSTSVKTKTKNSPTGSPIVQMFPRFMRTKPVTVQSNDLAKIPTSESATSLAYINDGSGVDLENQFSFTRNAEWHKSQDSLNQSHNVESSAKTDSFAEVAYTAKALCEPSRANSKNSSESQLDNAINHHRDDFIGDVSAASRHSKDCDCFDSDGNLTQETKEFTQDTTTDDLTPGEKNVLGLDGLMREIKDTLGVDDKSSGSDVTVQ